MIAYPTLRYCKIKGDYVESCDHEECAKRCPDNVCDGSGEVADLVYSSFDKNWHEEGTRPCICKLDY